jgi:hypothetical protein
MVDLGVPGLSRRFQLFGSFMGTETRIKEKKKRKGHEPLMFLLFPHSLHLLPLRFYAMNLSLSFSPLSKSCRFAFIAFDSAEQVNSVVKQIDGHRLDRQHVLAVNKFADIERYLKLGETFEAPKREEFKERVRERDFPAISSVLGGVDVHG